MGEMPPHLRARELSAASPAAGHARPRGPTHAIHFRVRHEFIVGQGRDPRGRTAKTQTRLQLTARQKRRSGSRPRRVARGEDRRAPRGRRRGAPDRRPPLRRGETFVRAARRLPRRSTAHRLASSRLLGTPRCTRRDRAPATEGTGSRDESEGRNGACASVQNRATAPPSFLLRDALTSLAWSTGRRLA